MNTAQNDPRQILAALFATATAAAQPAHCLPPFLPAPPAKGRIVVVGAGKAAAAMARVVEQHYQNVPLSGVVVTRYGHQLACERIRVLQAAHPVPDQASVAAAQAIPATIGRIDAGRHGVVLDFGWRLQPASLTRGRYYASAKARNQPQPIAQWRDN